GWGMGKPTLKGGTLQASTAVTVGHNVTVGGAVTVGGSNALSFNIGVPFGSSVTLQAGARLTVANTAQTTFWSINGAGSLVVDAGPGTVRIDSLTGMGGGNYTGGTTLLSGTLNIPLDITPGSGPLTLNGGTLVVGGGTVISNPFTVGGPANIVGQSTPVFMTGPGVLAAGG